MNMVSHDSLENSLWEEIESIQCGTRTKIQTKTICRLSKLSNKKWLKCIQIHNTTYTIRTQNVLCLTGIQRPYTEVENRIWFFACRTIWKIGMYRISTQNLTRNGTHVSIGMDVDVQQTPCTHSHWVTHTSAATEWIINIVCIWLCHSQSFFPHKSISVARIPNVFSPFHLCIAYCTFIG